jgi:glycine/D-amino acid oxidase-like deaminating enzyme
MPLAIEPTKRFLYFLRPEEPVMTADEWARLPMTIYGHGTELGSHSRPEGETLLISGTPPRLAYPDFADDDQDLVPAAFDHRNGIDNFGFSLLQEMSLYTPALASCGGLVATTSGFYGMTPDGVPLFGKDAVFPNLVHAAGFSGHGVMHAPISALLVEAIIAGDAPDGRLRMPAPFANSFLDLHAFDPARDFSHSAHESAVL